MCRAPDEAMTDKRQSPTEQLDEETVRRLLDEGRECRRKLEERLARNREPDWRARCQIAEATLAASVRECDRLRARAETCETIVRDYAERGACWCVISHSHDPDCVLRRACEWAAAHPVKP